MVQLNKIEHCHQPPNSFMPLVIQPLPYLQFLTVTSLLSMDLPFPECYINGMIQDFMFDFYVSTMLWRFIHVVVCIVLCGFLLLSCIPLYGRSTICLSTHHPSVDDFLVVSSLGATINRSSINILLQKFV